MRSPSRRRRQPHGRASRRREESVSDPSRRRCRNPLPRRGSITASEWRSRSRFRHHARTPARPTRCPRSRRAVALCAPTGLPRHPPGLVCRDPSRRHGRLGRGRGPAGAGLLPMGSIGSLRAFDPAHLPLAGATDEAHIGRGRPSRVHDLAAIPEPDRFSFPSGHATASLAVALSYGIAFPLLAGPLVLLALLVGYSRVRLRVHYPSDVLAGQLLAVVSVVAVGLWR